MPFTFNLGDFDFQDFEIPEEISFGGEQMHAVHKLLGGARVVDTFGRSDAPVTWAGRFRGINAAGRCLQVDRMRIDAAAVPLIVGPFRRTVVVTEFLYRPQQQGFEIPYSISCTVVTDDTVPLTPVAEPAVTDMVNSDMAQGSAMMPDLATSLEGVSPWIGSGSFASFQSLTTGDQSINALVTAAAAAAAGVGDFTQADQSSVASVISSVQGAQGQVDSLIGLLTGVGYPGSGF